MVKSLQQHCQAHFSSEMHHKFCCVMWPKLTIDWLVRLCPKLMTDWLASLCPKLTIDWLVSLCLEPGCQPWFSVRSLDLRKMGEDTNYQSLCQTGICWFSPVDVSVVPVKIKVASTMYQLKLSALCDLLEILCTMGPEASGSFC